MALRISKEKKAEVIKLLSEGYTKRYIEKTLGCDYRTTNNIIKSENIEYNPTYIDDSTKSKKKQKEKDELIKSLILQGWPKTRIEEVYHIDKRTTDSVIKRYNLEYKPIKNIGYTEHRFYELTKDQEEVLIGMMLGDSGMECSNVNARFSLNHSMKQRDYFYHKVEIFKNIMGETYEKDRFDSRTNKTYHCCAGKSHAAECFNKYYFDMYESGKKKIPDWMIEKMTIKSIAYWFMDDGSKRGVFATMCFDDEDLVKLQTVLLKHGIRTRLDGQRCIVVCNDDLLKFEVMIDPFVIDSMKYKLNKLYKNWNLKPFELLETPEVSNTTK